MAKHHIESIELSASIERAEQILGYEFHDKTLIAKAITHPSAVEEERDELSYERLEFLGDAYLGCIVALEVYTRFADMNEGGMTRLKSNATSGATLSQVAYELGFANIIIFGESERGTNGRGLHSALENVYESVVAALVLDSGIELAREWVLRTLGPYIKEELAQKPNNPKSRLQELLQEHGHIPCYQVIAEEGPPHDRVFRVQVSCQDKVLGDGEGRSKKEAEAAAAENAINALKNARNR